MVFFFHGPDRVPIFQERTQPAYRPFHGIISRGMINALQAGNNPLEWAKWNTLLDLALTGNPGASTRIPHNLVDLARSCDVLQFRESACVAEAFVGRHLAQIFANLALKYDPVELDRIEIWNVKEGHTSSVWQVSVLTSGQEEPICFALNVARDAAAGEELLASTEILEGMARRNPEIRIARVLAKAIVPSGKKNASQVPVVAQEWIEDAYELGYFKEDSSHRTRLFALDRFITDADNPGQLISVRGYRLKPNEHDCVVSEMAMATLLGSLFDLDLNQVIVPRFEINEGDWVWDWEHTTLVAVSSEQKVLSIGEALPYYLFHLPMKYGHGHPEVCEVLGRISRDALKEFCSLDDKITLPYWCDRFRTISWEPSQDLKYAGRKEDVLKYLAD